MNLGLFVINNDLLFLCGDWSLNLKEKRRKWTLTEANHEENRIIIRKFLIKFKSVSIVFTTLLHLSFELFSPFGQETPTQHQQYDLKHK